MRKLMLLAVATAAALVMPPPAAKAAVVSGSFITYGNAIPGSTPDSIIFVDNTPLFNANEFGDFALIGYNVNGQVDLSWRNIGQEVIVQALTTGSDLACGSNCLFSWGVAPTQGGWFNVSTVDQTALPPTSVLPDIGDVIVHGTGIMNFVGLPFDPSFGVWSMSMRVVAGTPNGWAHSFGYMSVPTSPVPVPAVGLGIGPLLAGVWLIRRYRRREEQAKKAAA